MTIFPTWYPDKGSADSTDKVWASNWSTNFNITVDEIWDEVFTDRDTDDLSEWTNEYYTDNKVSSNTLTLTNKTIDADWTGNVITNIGSSEVKWELISWQTTDTIASWDFILFSDTADSGNLKKIDIDNLPAWPQASETVSWTVELLTDAEAITWTDTTRAMTAANLKAVSNDFDFVTVDETINEQATTSRTYNHSLWRVPTKFELAVGWTNGSHWWYEDWKYWSVSVGLWASEAAIWTIWYAGGDYYVMTIDTITTTTFRVVYTEVWTTGNTGWSLCFRLS